VLAADPNRRSLKRDEWMNEFFNTSSNPVGHGFSQTDANSGFACYSFEPETDLPVKVIVLDDTQQDEDQNIGSYAYSSLDQVRFGWLISELRKGHALSRTYAVASSQLFNTQEPYLPSGAYNAELVKQLRSDMQLIIQKY
jgi:hypothetical protein